MKPSILDPKPLLAEVRIRLGLACKEEELWIKAFTHESYSNEVDNTPHYERLEFLGDSILGFVVTEELFRRFQDRSEGELALMKSHLVSRKSLYQVALNLKVGELIRIGRGELLGGERRQTSIQADCIEAIIGALFLEEGIEKARVWVREKWQPLLSQADDIPKDYKSILQEKAQALYKKMPTYQLLKTEGPAHDATFTLSVTLLGVVLGVGVGRSKREAGQLAAQAALVDSQDNRQKWERISVAYSENNS